MPQPSRRSLLLAAGAGSVALGSGVALVGPAGAASPSGSSTGSESGRIVAYVSDVASGEITVMRGDSETVVTDVSLARSLARLAG